MKAALAISPGEQLRRMQQAAADFGEGRQTSSGLVIPRNAVPFLAIASAVSPAFGIANQVVLASYTVPTSWFVLVSGVLFAFDGMGLVPGRGDILWSVDVNRPLGSTLGYGEKDFSAITWPLGSYIAGPWPCEFRHYDGETIRVKAYTTANVGVGDPNRITGALYGFSWPGMKA
jgi:hypothetical protein